MGRASEMGGLTQEILSGFTARVNEQKGRQASVARFLSETTASRKGAFQRLHQRIVAGRQERNRQVAAMRQHLAEMVAGFHREQALAHTYWLDLEKTLGGKRAAAN